MDSSMEDDSSDDSIITTDDSYCTQYETKVNGTKIKQDVNVVKKIINRQLYGRFTKNPRTKTERIYEKIPESCNRLVSEVLPEWDANAAMQHIYMGFTICGQYLLSYTCLTEEDLHSMQVYSCIYYLYVWRYLPGRRLQLVSKHQIFRHYRPQKLLDITFSQWPSDRHKVVAHGVNLSSLNNPVDAYITVIFLPHSKSCADCYVTSLEDDLVDAPCLEHSVTVDFMISMTTLYPLCNPIMHLAYPEHIVINTGHYLHIINVSYIKPKPQHTNTSNFPISDKPNFALPISDKPAQFPTYSDTQSEISEPDLEPNAATDNRTNIVEAIIQDFSEYDLESNDCSKPFHELNISCEPLNVTGKNYFNTNYSEARLKLLENDKFLINNAQTGAQKGANTLMNAQTGAQKASISSVAQKGLIYAQKSQIVSQPKEKSKIDKKIAEKAYEFTEDTEKCEKLSSFRKKRLADKKYEFSEDNSENIVPFQLLRQERRFLLRNQNRFIRSPDYWQRAQGLRSPRSPILSPSSPRNIYCPTLRMSPLSCRSPISPRDSARKFNVYSPSHIDSDCSDYDSKLVLKQQFSARNSGRLDFLCCDSSRSLCSAAGLLIVDGKKIEEKPRWIRQVVKRYCNLDFESASLISDVQSRDEYLCIDMPTVVHTANNNLIDAVPPRVSDELIGPHLKVTQKTFDFEQFCQRRAEKLCSENRLKFTHCEDYDIKIQHICPLSGDIVCTAELKIGAVKEQQNSGTDRAQAYITNCMFVWNICTDAYKVMESSQEPRLVMANKRDSCAQSTTLTDLPQIHCKKVHYMSHNSEKSLPYLRDSDNYIQISMDKDCGFMNFSYDDFDSSYQISPDISDSNDIF